MPQPAQIVVRDRRKKRQWSTDNLIQDHWRPVLGGDGFDLYSLYLKLSNAKDERAFPGYELIHGHLGFSSSTIRNYNCLLGWCRLIHIEQGNRFTANDYYILDVPEVTPECLADVRAAALAWNKDERFVKALLKRLDTWHPLQFWFKRNRRGKPILIHPNQMQMDLPSSTVEDGTSSLEQGASTVEAQTLSVEDGTLTLEARSSRVKVEQSEQYSPNSTIRNETINKNNSAAHEQSAAGNSNGHRADVVAGGESEEERKHTLLVLKRAGFKDPAPNNLQRQGVEFWTALEWAYWVQSEESDDFKKPHGWAIAYLNRNPTASPDGLGEINELIRDDPDRFKCKGNCAFCEPNGEWDRTTYLMLEAPQVQSHSEERASRGKKTWYSRETSRVIQR